MSVSGACEAQKRILLNLELELYMLMNYDLSTENWTWDFYKSSKHT